MVVWEGARSGERKSQRVEKLSIVGKTGKREHSLAAQRVGNRQLDFARQKNIGIAQRSAPFAKESGIVIDDHVEIAMKLQMLEAIVEDEDVGWIS